MKKIPIKMNDKVIGTAIVDDENNATCEIDISLLTDEERKLLFGDTFNYLSIGE